jgi:hypothetical protein
MKQDFRTGSVDMITAGELSEELHKHLGTMFSRHQRETYAGIKAFKIPVIVQTAQSAGFTLSAPVGSNVPGPDSGFIWRIERINVNSATLADTATWSLYAGSDIVPGPRTLVDNGGSTGLKVNQAYYPGNNKGLLVWPDEQLYAVVAGATVNTQYTLLGVAVETPIEMQGKIVGG